MSLKLKRRGKFWHYEGTVAGRRLRKSTGTTIKAIAERIKAEAEDSAWRRKFDGLGSNVTFAQAAIAYRELGKSERFLARVEDYWKDTPIKKISAGAIRQSAEKLYPRAKGSTRNRQIIAPTQAIINFASELEWCAPIKVKRFKVATKTKVPATLSWIKAFADQAYSDGLPHLAALAMFMFGTGARRGEACGLVWANIDLFAKRAVIHQTKVDDTRTAHMQQEVVVAIANIPSNRKDDEPVFGYASGESVGQVWGNVCERAGIAKLTPHSCRHGFATGMLQAGKDIKTVVSHGGWKDAGTVLKYYAHAVDDLTVTDVLFDTNLTHDTSSNNISHSNKRNNSL